MIGNLIRIIVGIPIAAGVTFGLFVLMNTLISGGDLELEEEGEERRIVINEQPEEVDPNRRQVDLNEVEDVVPPPPPPQIERQKADQPNENMETVVGDLPDFEAPDLSGDQVSFDVSDRDAQPLVRLQPQYPPRAAERGTEGSCSFTFDVTPQGNPTNFEIIDCPSVFRRSSERAVEKWRYEPKIVDGNPVWRRGVVSSFDYQLEG